jgi:cholesterol oxidase
MDKEYEAIVIGSGFGGAITGCRLAKQWPQGGVLILERGKRYPMGSFPRKPHDFARVCSESTSHVESGTRASPGS